MRRPPAAATRGQRAGAEAGRCGQRDAAARGAAGPADRNRGDQRQPEGCRPSARRVAQGRRDSPHTARIVGHRREPVLRRQRRSTSQRRATPGAGTCETAQGRTGDGRYLDRVRPALGAMNLHETLTNGRSIAHAVPVAFRERQGDRARSRPLPARSWPAPAPPLAPDRHRRPLRRAAPARGRLRGHVRLPRHAGCGRQRPPDHPAHARLLPAGAERVAGRRRQLPAGRARQPDRRPCGATTRSAAARPPYGSNSRTTQSAVGEQVAQSRVRGPVTDLLAGPRPGARRPGAHAGRRARRRCRAAPARRARHRRSPALRSRRRVAR